jgi:glycosyltransferase involved in cell wall biosynthesis
MNIGIDAKRIFFNNSGLGNYGRRFYLALAKNLPGDSFCLYTPKPVPADNPYLKEINLTNSRIIEPEEPFHKILGGSLWRSGLIRRQLLQDKIGIYYGLSNEIPFGINKLNLKKAVIIHDLIFLRYPELYPKFDVLFYKKKTKYACAHSDFIIAASEQTKKDIIDFYGTHHAKISVLYPCSAPMFYQEETEDSSLFFKPARDYIISIGAITPRKNLLKTVQALNLVKDRYNLDLVVIGTAVGMGRKYLESIEDYIQKNGLTDRVHFLGNVPYKFVPDLCRKAQLMIYPSQFEGFGMPIVEGLFSKIPVITSQGGCFPEAGGDGAVYINPNDPEEIANRVERIMESQELRNELILKGIRHAGRFTQVNIENDILKFHQTISAKDK